MLQTCGEIAQGTILVWSAPEAGRRAAENLAIGAKRAGRRVEDIDIVLLLPMSIAQDRKAAMARIRPLIAFLRRILSSL